MITPHHLKSSPITEAVIDIRVKARQNFSASDFGKLRTELHVQFPTVEERRESHYNIQFTRTEVKPTGIEDLGLQGLFFKSEDKTLLAQFRIDGFTLNKLKPYTSWEELQSIFLNLWNQYQVIAQPDAITRIAMRYINHITINQKNIDFDDYFAASPKIPPNLPQYFAGFLSRTTIVDPENKIAAHVTQAFDPKPSDQPITVIFDIDAFKEIETSPNDLDLVSLFSKLELFKNTIFFSYLTAKTIGLFE